MKTGDRVRLPDNGEPAYPNGPRRLNVTGKVLEVRRELALVRWDRGGADLAKCGVGGGWYEVSELQIVEEAKA